jgi:hypothetical protein
MPALEIPTAVSRRPDTPECQDAIGILHGYPLHSAGTITRNNQQIVAGSPFNSVN